MYTEQQIQYKHSMQKNATNSGIRYHSTVSHTGRNDEPLQIYSASDKTATLPLFLYNSEMNCFYYFFVNGNVKTFDTASFRPVE